VSQILSAGTINDLNLLDSNRPNYLAAVFREGKKFGLAYVDHTTGEFEVAEFKDTTELADELERLQASELLHSDDQREVIDALGSPACAQPVESYLFPARSGPAQPHAAFQSAVARWIRLSPA
jgi:DNA mismatch repair protein MutS